jgi:hypothetical protein
MIGLTMPVTVLEAVATVRLGLAGEGVLQVLLGLGAFENHDYLLSRLLKSG